MKIMFATDGSQQSATAARTAAHLLRKEDFQADVVCVVPDYLPPRSSEKKSPHKLTQRLGQFREQLKREANQMLLNAQTALKAEGIEAGVRSASGSPTKQLLALGADYDLIVVGAHDRFTRGKPGLGPVAERLVAQTLTATLIGRDLKAERSWRVLVAVDGSLAGYHALQRALAWLNLDSTEITLMHVTETPWFQLGDESHWQNRRKWQDWLPEAEDEYGVGEPIVPLSRELHHEAETVLNYAHRILEQQGLGASNIIEEGDPALEILSQAEEGEYDLIILGATGAPGNSPDLKHDLLGSVSAKVARDAPCSVFIARFIE